MKIGIVGKPSSGKSTFFKAATLIDVKISPIPFTTIEPNIGIAYVRVECVDREFGKSCNPTKGFCINGNRFVPIKLLDVAGLVPGAHQGKGLGNKFLDELRNADCLIHVVDFSGLTDEEGKPTQGHDPLKDIKFLEREIDLWFAKVLERALGKYLAMMKRGVSMPIEKILEKQLSGLGVKKWQIIKALEKYSITQINEFAAELRKMSKPILIAANKIDLKEAQKNFEKLKNLQNVVPVSSEAEVALRLAAKKKLISYIPGDGDFEIIGKVNPRQKQALEIIKQNVLKKYGSTGVQQCLNKAVFEVLDYIVAYPVANENSLTDKKGNVLPDAFLIRKGTTLKEFAKMVHSEIAERLIGGIDVRTKKRLGSSYKLNNQDVIKLLFR